MEKSGVGGGIGIQNLRDYIRKTDREPLIGLEWILEYRVQGKRQEIVTKYFCEVCDLHCELVPMIEHLSSMKHRKLYLARAFPQVLGAPPPTKEDKTLFLRRMAMEIEQREGVKTFKSDPILRKLFTQNGQTSEINVPKQSARWELTNRKHARWIRALEYLQSFDIDSDMEALIVTNLTQKLTSDLKEYSLKLKADPAFPDKVTKAKDVAASIMQKSTNERPTQPIANQGQQMPPNRGQQMHPNRGQQMHPNRGQQMPPNRGQQMHPNQGQQMPPNRGQQMQHNQGQQMPLNRGQQMQHNQGQQMQPNRGQQMQHNQGQQMPPNLGPQIPLPLFYKGQPANFNLGMLGGPFVPPFPMGNLLNFAPNMAFPQGPHPLPFFPPNPQQMGPANMAEHALQAQAPLPGFQPPSDPSTEDAKFFKKLMNLLSALPQNPNNPAMASEPLVPKPLFDQRPPMENMAGGQAFGAPSMAGAEDAVKQKILALLASQNPASVSQLNRNMMASEGGNVPPMEDAQANQNKLLQLLLQSRQKSGMTQKESSLPSNQNIPDQGHGPMDRNRKGPMNQFPERMGGGEPRREPLPVDSRPRLHEDYPPGARKSKWDQPHDRPDPPYGDHPADPTPYTRITLSPSNERFPESDSDRGRRRRRSQERTRPPRRQFDDPDWALRERGAAQEKRPREEDEFFSRSAEEIEEKRRNESGPNLSVDLLKRIRGKDMFTVSAILSEYAENQG